MSIIYRINEYVELWVEQAVCYNVYMTKKHKQLAVKAIVVFAMLGLLLTTFLPFLSVIFK